MSFSCVRFLTTYRTVHLYYDLGVALQVYVGDKGMGTRVARVSLLAITGVVTFATSFVLPNPRLASPSCVSRGCHPAALDLGASCKLTGALRPTAEQRRQRARSTTLRMVSGFYMPWTSTSQIS